jgi:hypothetical protein
MGDGRSSFGLGRWETKAPKEEGKGEEHYEQKLSILFSIPLSIAKISS